MQEISLKFSLIFVHFGCLQTDIKNTDIMKNN